MRTPVDIRPGEVAGTWPAPDDAALSFIGRIATPWPTRRECPKRGDPIDGPLCRIEIFKPWHAGLLGIGQQARLQVLYWMHLARRDLLHQRPHGAERCVGTFAVRSPVRPNPIAVSRVTLVGMEYGVLLVRGLDCVDGTPLIDVKPEHCPADGH